MSSLSISGYNDLQDFVSVSSRATDSILAGKQIRIFIRGLSNVFLVVFLSFFIIPLGLVLYLFLTYQVWKLRRYVLRDFTLNLSNYKTYRQQFDKLSPLVDKLQPISDFKLGQVKWYDRPFVKLAIEAAQIVTAHHATICAKLTELDIPPHHLPTGWRVVSGHELWKDRPAGYEYLI